VFYDQRRLPVGVKLANSPVIPIIKKNKNKNKIEIEIKDYHNY
jgi:hypothetical protein